jgi:hypothetical protein
MTCWLRNGLAYGRCIPQPESGLSFYGSDISNGVIDHSGWTSTGSAFHEMNCSNSYNGLWGVNNTSPQNNISISWSTTNLPSHTDLYIVFNLFKTDIAFPYQNGNKSQNIYVNTGDGKISTVELTNRKNGQLVVPGTNLCEGDGN